MTYLLLITQNFLSWEWAYWGLKWSWEGLLGQAELPHSSSQFSLDHFHAHIICVCINLPALNHICCNSGLPNCMTCAYRICSGCCSACLGPWGVEQCLWWWCWVLVSVSQMDVRDTPCWRCHRMASPCHWPLSSQVSAGSKDSSNTCMWTVLWQRYSEKKLVAPVQTRCGIIDCKQKHCCCASVLNLNRL